MGCITHGSRIPQRRSGRLRIYRSTRGCSSGIFCALASRAAGALRRARRRSEDQICWRRIIWRAPSLKAHRERLMFFESTFLWAFWWQIITPIWTRMFYHFVGFSRCCTPDRRRTRLMGFLLRDRCSSSRMRRGWHFHPGNWSLTWMTWRFGLLYVFRYKNLGLCPRSRRLLDSQRLHYRFLRRRPIWMLGARGHTFICSSGLSCYWWSCCNTRPVLYYKIC